ncbi:hypothetical protein MMC28_008545 [Mycoblastus sanguinarius]|nr:hypothetical protein [Mycoblastus sanguinarius]
MTFTKLGFNYNGLQDGLNATQLAEVPNQEEDDKDEDEVEEGEIEEGKMDEGGFDDDEVEEAAAKKGKEADAEESPPIPEDFPLAKIFNGPVNFLEVRLAFLMKASSKSAKRWAWLVIVTLLCGVKS